jgi:hypothetical protein
MLEWDSLNVVPKQHVNKVKLKCNIDAMVKSYNSPIFQKQRKIKWSELQKLHQLHYNLLIVCA